MSIPRRLGRIARGFVSNLQEDERFNDAIRSGRRTSESLKGALSDAWRGASEEWRTSEEQRKDDEAAREEENPNYGRREQESREEEREKTRSAGGWRSSASSAFTGMKYPPEVLRGYDRLDLVPGASLSEVDRKRRELIKRYHPDRFSDPDKRARAERVSAEINAAHDKIERHLLKRS